MKKHFLTGFTAVAICFLGSSVAEAAWDEATLNAVVNTLDLFWEGFLGEFGIYYYYPAVYLHEGIEPTPCGPSDFAHYCGATNTIHLNVVEMNNLAYAVGDSAAYLVLAHEYAHSVQNHLGLFSPEFSTTTLELQADCLAGIFFAGADYLGLLEPGDLEEGLFTAFISGDFNFEDPGHHGVPEQRANAFVSGFSDPRYCF